MIIITALIKAKEGQGDEMEKAIKDFAPKYLKDPGCLEYRLHRRLDNPDWFFFYEKYENEEALKYHSSAPHFKEMGLAMRPFMDGRPEIAKLRAI